MDTWVSHYLNLFLIYSSFTFLKNWWVVQILDYTADDWAVATNTIVHPFTGLAVSNYPWPLQLPLEIWLPFSMGVGPGELGEVWLLAFLSCSCGEEEVGPCSSLPGRFMLELEKPGSRKKKELRVYVPLKTSFDKLLSFVTNNNRPKQWPFVHQTCEMWRGWCDGRKCAECRAYTCRFQPSRANAAAAQEMRVPCWHQRRKQRKQEGLALSHAACRPAWIWPPPRWI